MAACAAMTKESASKDAGSMGGEDGDKVTWLGPDRLSITTPEPVLYDYASRNHSRERI